MVLPNVLSIVGQTATGKTALAIRLANAFDGEIISADSRQVYRGMDLGSGKATPEEQALAPHHLLDIADPHTDRYTVADFVRDGRVAIDDIVGRAHLPIIAGGTFLYTDALLGRVSFPAVPPDPALREQLEHMPTADLFAQLAGCDPHRAATIDRNNRPRLIRAIEIARALGAVPRSVQEERYRVRSIGLAIHPEVLRERIRTRLLDRLETGMIEEVAALHRNGVSWERLHSFGLEYRRVAEFLRGVLPTREVLVEVLERDIRAFAKRQMTWLKRDKSIMWYPFDAYEMIEHDVRQWLYPHR